MPHVSTLAGVIVFTVFHVTSVKLFVSTPWLSFMLISSDENRQLDVPVQTEELKIKYSMKYVLQLRHIETECGETQFL